MNFKHLHYFWVAAKAGGVVRAGAQLHITPQTLSGQIKLLEERLGRALFRRSGRRLELTDEGRMALRYADDIFAIGGELEAAMRQGAASSAPVLEFRVGVEDVVAKTVAYRLLAPALDAVASVRMICVEGQFDDLMAKLALHRLDLVVADEPLGSRLSIKAFNHALGRSALGFFGTPALRARLDGPFPACLHGAPMLLPGGSSSVRPQLDAWFTEQGVRPRVVAEFNDSALALAFGREGRGIFVAPLVVRAETCQQSGVELIGEAAELVEDFYAISVERRIKHPCVAAVTQAARGELFG